MFRPPMFRRGHTSSQPADLLALILPFLLLAALILPVGAAEAGEPPQLAAVVAIQPAKLQPLFGAAMAVMQEMLEPRLEPYLLSQLLRYVGEHIWLAYYEGEGPAEEGVAQPAASAGRGEGGANAADAGRAGAARPLFRAHGGEALLAVEFDPAPIHLRLPVGGSEMQVATRQTLSGRVLAGVAALALEQLVKRFSGGLEARPVGEVTIYVSSRGADRGSARRTLPLAYAQQGSRLLLASSASLLTQVLEGAGSDPLLPLRTFLQSLRPAVRDHPLRLLAVNRGRRLQHHLGLLEQRWGMSLFLHKEALEMLGLTLKPGQPGTVEGSLELFAARPAEVAAVQEDAEMFLDLFSRRFLNDRYRLTSSSTHGPSMSQVSFVLEPPQASWESLLRQIVAASR